MKDAFRRDWEQTKHDFGAKSSPELNQGMDDTVKQAVGKQPIPPGNLPNFEDYENAYQFGYGARRHFANRFNDWDEELESELRSSWGSTHRGGKNDWPRYREQVRRGWQYGGTAGQTGEEPHRRAA